MSVIGKGKVVPVLN